MQTHFLFRQNELFCAEVFEIERLLIKERQQLAAVTFGRSSALKFTETCSILNLNFLIAKKLELFKLSLSTGRRAIGYNILIGRTIVCAGSILVQDL